MTRTQAARRRRALRPDLLRSALVLAALADVLAIAPAYAWGYGLPGAYTPATADALLVGLSVMAGLSAGAFVLALMAAWEARP